MKYFLSLFICISVIFNSFAQDYKLERKEINKENKNPKWSINIVYTAIGGTTSEGYAAYNKLVKQMMLAEKDSFMVWMKDWEVSKDAPKDMGSYYEIGDTIMHIDSKIVSSHFYGSSYFRGAAHPNNWSFSLNFDVEKQKEIKINDLFSGDYLKFLSDYCIKEVLKQKQEYDSSLTQPDEMLLEGAAPKEDNYQVFNFIHDGFLITFPTYQVGAYVEGPHEVLIPYNLLKEYVKKGSLSGNYIK